MGILNVGTQALQANLVALQTAGNNIANANVEGYSRQKVIMETVAGQFTGGGYIGKGVSIQTIQSTSMRSSRARPPWPRQPSRPT